ncbi:MAG: hypothetical protein PHH06_02250 [Candidatus Gracilibacteria bacterium]|nr:hypothetical protein [Candidatus Gracilibacteria bacterium]
MQKSNKKIFKEYLKEIGKNKLSFVKTLKPIGKEKEVFLNMSIFNEIPDDIIAYKKGFLLKIEKKKKGLKKVKQKLYDEKKLDGLHIKIIKNEIEYNEYVLDFLKKTYDIEANKINKKYKIEKNDINYDKYNVKFFGVDKSRIDKFDLDATSIHAKIDDRYVEKKELVKLINFSKKICPEIDFIFGDYINQAQDGGIVKIPNDSSYSIRSIITLFFHETTHAFRYINGKINLGFNYSFSDKAELEEGIALYNEYKYGKKIIDGLEYVPYYDMAFKAILEDISEEEKKEKIYQILKFKGFTKEKSDQYYYRFYRFSELGSTKLFLKDLIYTKSYEFVKNLIKSDKSNYEKILSGRIGTYEINNNLISKNNNLDSKKYFESMLKKIKSIL